MEKTWLAKLLEKIFVQDGKVYAGMATGLIFLCVILDSVWDKWQTPEWFTAAPWGVYCIILVTFAGTTTLSKIYEFWVNSKYNSPQGFPPAVVPPVVVPQAPMAAMPPATMPTMPPVK